LLVHRVPVYLAPSGLVHLSITESRLKSVIDRALPFGLRPANSETRQEFKTKTSFLFRVYAKTFVPPIT
ncbi:hypothetical protein, partial [Thalassospira sp. UBA848]|uniref:hypothetical protein n=1 Tax=Thalassospira sp. UBA848 TaxID=1947677 RepID=UPI0025F0A300